MQVKNIVSISLMVFIIVVIGILGASVLTGQGKSNVTANPQNGNAPANTNIASYSLSDIAKHNNSSDCWMAVNNNVYDVTNLIPTHSGGAEAMIPFCGKDASVAFNTKNGNGSHSQRAQETLKTDYLIGSLSK